MFLTAGFERLACGILVLALFCPAAALAQQLHDNNVFLRTRERILADIERMPRYTCVQTINRHYYRPHHHGASCATLMADHKPEPDKDLLRAWDRLRVEIALVNGKTSFSWVGAPEFDSDATEAIQRFAGQGPFNTGDFVAFLHTILNKATVSFAGEESQGQQRLLAYRYSVPLERTNYRIKDKNGWTPTAFEGKLLVDPDALDIVSLTVRTAELSEANPDCQAISHVDYGRTAIHDSMVLIPRQTELVTISRDGSESHSLTTYASCREYSSKVRLFLDGAATSPGGSVASASSGLPNLLPDLIPSGLQFRARILTVLDSNTSAAGDPIDAVLLTPIRDKNKIELAPAGARLHGRLLMLEQRLSNQNYFLVSMQFESIDLKSRSVPLHAVPEISMAPNNMTVSGWQRQSNDSVDGTVAGDAAFFLVRQEHLHLEKFESRWITRIPALKEDANAPSPDPR